MDPIIELKQLNFTYNKGKDNEFRALININLQIYADEFIVVFGPSGCGKSTLLNIIAGLETPESGTLTVFGKDLTNMNKTEFSNYHKTQVGMIFQAYNLITSLTVLDNVALPQMFINKRKRKREEEAKKLLERFGILPQARKIPTELSGGQQQRIGIARAIVNNPSLVLADEPVGNLDSVSARNVLEILADLNEKEKKTIILVTHNPENLIYADRILYMKDGLIVREVVNKDKHRDQKEKKEAPKTATAEIADLMRAYHGLTPEEINILIMPYKSKVFAHHFISNRNLEETKVFEDVIQRRLLGTISQEELTDILNRPSNQGGVGFDIRRSGKIIRRINRIIRMAYFIYQKSHQQKDEKGEHAKISDDEKAAKLGEYLLKTCYYEHMNNLTEAQIMRLRQAIKDRLSATIQKMDLYNLLDSSLKDGGAGLNSKTAKAITEELELILILGFGVIQVVKNIADENKRKEKENNNIDDEIKEIDEENAKDKIETPPPAPPAPDPSAVLPAEPELPVEMKSALTTAEPTAPEINQASLPKIRTLQEAIEEAQAREEKVKATADNIKNEKSI